MSDFDDFVNYAGGRAISDQTVLTYETLTMQNLAQHERIRGLEEALNRIACWGDKPANDLLGKVGSYGRFDEPASVKIAREALAE